MNKKENKMIGSHRHVAGGMMKHAKGKPAPEPGTGARALARLRKKTEAEMLGTDAPIQIIDELTNP